MRSFTDRTGVSIAAGRVGAGVFVIVVADLISRTAAVGWAVRRTGCVCSFRRVCSIGRHPFEELGRLEAMVRGAPNSEHRTSVLGGSQFRATSCAMQSDAVMMATWECRCFLVR
jgi:hypothetical protein